MKIIIGLGNPGLKYVYTRHNIGFRVVEAFRDSFGNDTSFIFQKKFNAEIAEIFIESEKILLLKPQTFMNNSGESVQKIVSYFNIDPAKEMIVVYDEIDLPFGDIRTSGNSAGGHKGMSSIISTLDTKEIRRIRVGISNEHSENIETARFVLDTFSKNELEKIDDSILEKTNTALKNFVQE